MMMQICSIIKKAVLYFFLSHGSMVLAQQDSLKISLAELFKMADVGNKQIKLSNALLERSQLTVRDKKNDRLPTVGVNGSVGYLTNVGVIGLGTMNSGFYDMPHFSNSYALQAGLVLYSGGKITTAIDMAKIENRIAGLDLIKDSQSIRLVLTGYFLDLYKGYNQKKVFEKNITLGRDLLKKINNRYQLGTALKSDLIRNELLVSTYELALSKLKDRIAITNYTITSMLALNKGTVLIPQAVETPKASAELVLNDSIEKVINTALAGNADYQKYELRVALAQKKKQQVKSSDYPQIELFVNSTFARPYTFDIPAKDIYAYNNAIGLRVNYSLSNLYQSGRKKDIAQSDIGIATLTQELAKESLSREVNSGFINLKQSFNQLNTLYKQQELAQENYKRIADSYLEQLTLNTEVTDASNQRLEADLRVTDAQAEILFNYFQLLKSLGQL
jgi:outer membrane protein TolC